MNSKIVLAVFLLAGFVACQDTDLSEGEASFESEFHVKYGNKEDEKKAGEILAKAEKQINEQNKLFKEGKSTFYEQLNEFSDLSKSQFEKEKEGAKIPEPGRVEVLEPSCHQSPSGTPAQSLKSSMLPGKPHPAASMPLPLVWLLLQETRCLVDLVLPLLQLELMRPACLRLEQE